MFGFLKPGPNYSLTYIYPSTNQPNMVGCLDYCSDPNSEQFKCPDDCIEQNSEQLYFKHILGHKNILFQKFLTFCSDMPRSVFRKKS